MGNTIISAVYGTTNNGIDVTKICQSMVDKGDDDITANNATFTDPDPGVGKSFGILYSNPALNGGNPIALGCKEGATIDLVPNPPTATTPVPPTNPALFKVVHATYGTARNGFDVTQTCQWILNNGASSIAINNGSFGDPDVGSQKNFAIIYTAAGGGPTASLAAVEGAVLTLR